MKKLLFSFLVLGITSVLAIGATTAYFSDTEISTGNTFTAGTLDLKLDGGDENVVKFNLDNIRPGNQPQGTYTLKNAGSITGNLTISGITIADNENILSEPEKEAGDTSDTIGELSQVVNLRIYLDLDKNGSYSTGDIMLFNNKVSNLPSSIDTGLTLAADEDVNVKFLFDWWNTPIDNQAQGDSMMLDLEFMLKQ